MRVLVLGASGMAGHVVATYLEERGHEVTRVAGRRKVTPDTILLDLSIEAGGVDALYDSLTDFDVVVNCAGVLVKQAEMFNTMAIALNSLLPQTLKVRTEGTPTKLVHLSTDCVFSGENGPYYEDSPYDGQLFYDRSKALGEVVNGKDLTLRMSIVGPELGPGGTGLFHWFMNQEDQVFGYANHIWNGVTTLTLAKAINRALAENLTGLYHLVPKQETISKYDLLRLFASKFKPGIKVSPLTVKPVNKALVNTRDDFDFQVPSYADMIVDMRGWVESHPELYKHYNEVTNG